MFHSLRCQTGREGFLFPGKRRKFEVGAKRGRSRWREPGKGKPRCCVVTSVYRANWRQLTPLAGHSRVKVRLMGVSKLQVGQLWKKDGTKDIYLVTRLFSEALSTMVILRKSGSEGEAQIRVRVERAADGAHSIPGFSPAQEDEKF